MSKCIICHDSYCEKATLLGIISVPLCDFHDYEFQINQKAREYASEISTMGFKLGLVQAHPSVASMVDVTNLMKEKTELVNKAADFIKGWIENMQATAVQKAREETVRSK